MEPTHWQPDLNGLSNKQREINTAMSKFTDPTDQHARAVLLASVMSLLNSITDPAEALLQRSGIVSINTGKARLNLAEIY